MKSIIICCDGTGNQFESNITNVVEAYQLAIKSEAQVTYYDPGVGTGGWVYEEESGNFRALTDKATGGGLQKNIEDAYRYLMQVYEGGDQIFMFGFSRGAFTVRALAGMLHKCGLLDSTSDNMVEYASKIYNTDGNNKLAKDFKATFCKSCPVHFIGVWDTVGSLVLNAGKKFHDATLNRDVTYGYHAMALDEVRKDFPISRWDKKPLSHQTIEEVWFAGVHSNVGGWYKDRGLSNCALQWMMAKAKDCGMLINESKLQKKSGNPLDKLEDSHTGFWNFRGKDIRRVKSDDWLHQSVIDRINHEPSQYTPTPKLPKKFNVAT